MKDGDIILSVDHKPIDGTENLIQMVSSHRPGETVNIGILRDGKDITLTVKLADRSETLLASNEGGDEEEEGDAQRHETAAQLGFSVSELNPGLFREVAGRIELPKSHPEGVLVTKVAPTGPAYEAGLSVGSIITQIGKEAVPSLAEFRRIASKVQKGDVVRLTAAYYVLGRRGDLPSQESRFIFFEAE